MTVREETKDSPGISCLLQFSVLLEHAGKQLLTETATFGHVIAGNTLWIVGLTVKHL